MQFRVFYYGQKRYRIGIFFGVAKIKYCLGVLEIPDIFWGEW